jgi:hypothetical protein
MNQTSTTSKNYVAEHRRERFDFRDSTAAQPRERLLTLIDMPRPRIIDRLWSGWFALRTWEDDGGGQAQLS